MTAARRTLGDGRASTTKAASSSAAAGARARSGTRIRRQSRSAADSTTATLVPDTATRCVRPTVLKSAFSAGSNLLVSPTTSPGSSPRSASGSGATARRKPARSEPATRCSRLGGPRMRTWPRADRTAATSSPRPAACSRPSARTRWLGSRASHPLSSDSTTTGERSRTVRPATCSCSTLTRTTTSSRTARTPEPALGSTDRGSSATTPSTVTDAALTPASCSGPVVRAWTRADVANAAAAAQTSTPATSAVRRRTATVPARATSADTARTGPGGRCRLASATSQTASAGASSRRSGWPVTPGPCCAATGSRNRRYPRRARMGR